MLYFVTLHFVSLLCAIAFVSTALCRSHRTRQLSKIAGHQLGCRSHTLRLSHLRKLRDYFLKQLRRAGVLQAQLLYFYAGVVRPVLEYAVPVWNHLLTKTQIDQIEAIQRRALRIIYSYTNDMPYISALYCAAISTLAD